MLGLGLTQILTAIGRLIRHRERVRVHWLPLLWAGMLILIYVQVWWASYGLRFRQEWSFLEFAIVLAQTATLYIMAALALPDEVDDVGIDLGTYFNRQHRWFFGFFLATIVISVVKDVALDGRLPDRMNLAFHVLFAIGCAAGIVLRRRRYQEALGLGFAMALLAYVGVLFARLR